MPNVIDTPVGLYAEDIFITWIDWVDRRLKAVADQVSERAISDRALVLVCAQDGYRFGVKELGQVFNR
jgi:hypothetical protein